MLVLSLSSKLYKIPATSETESENFIGLLNLTIMPEWEYKFGFTQSMDLSIYVSPLSMKILISSGFLEFKT